MEPPPWASAPIPSPPRRNYEISPSRRLRASRPVGVQGSRTDHRTLFNKWNALAPTQPLKFYSLAGTILPLLLVIAAAPALADACDDAAQRIATEVGNAYAIRTGPVITIKRGRRTFHYTLECADGQPSMVSGGCGLRHRHGGISAERSSARQASPLDVPENVARAPWTSARASPRGTARMGRGRRTTRPP
ncbi:hypothetical protein CMV_016954 [Castanea mollissima]|uniref:Uncharacterized protein n=1 Tax=Castanea mollissima TaxID=60419 RepID=A0A8J4QYR6_9ROSI|nr:hypothetical protein CMV_016954 [Castanea mollissima]